ncbi:MAG TPA: cyclic nucleotide-binding domain-containing protein [Methylocella sp.]|nr:cyclic nucleotide-binding domain-containing protein [Methylocella sp.]
MGFEVNIGQLACNRFLAAIEPAALEFIAYSAEARQLRAGDVLFRLNDVSHDGFAVLTGSIALDPSGEGRAVARIIRPPSLIGELALITETRRPATAIAREPSTVLRISRQLFHRALQEFPESATRLHQSLSADMQQYMSRLGAVRETLSKGMEPENEGKVSTNSSDS